MSRVDSSLANPLLSDDPEQPGQSEADTKKSGWTITAKNVSYTVTLPPSAPWRRGVKKQILDAINITFEAGTCTALMGPSGSGKTTLLEVVGGFNHNRGLVTGSLEATDPGSDTSTKQALETGSCLIPQDDVLLAGLTPRETLKFSALLRKVDSARVELMLKQLGLVECADTRVGSPEKRGLSGGQRKRVSIALELLDNPSCVLCDEPTSGLDSKMASDVVTLLTNLARTNGKTVVCTIHQPNLRMFRSFDQVALVARGRLAYAGRTPETYFASELPVGENPAEIFMEWLQDDLRVADLLERWQPKTTAAVTSEDEGTATKKMTCCPSTSTSTTKRNASSRRVMLLQASILARRRILDKLKDPEQYAQSLTVKLMVGLIIGLVWINQSGHTQDTIFPVQGALFIVSINSMMDTVFVTALSLTTSKTLLLRELRNGYYSLLPRHIAVIAVDCLLAAMNTFALALPVYYLVGLRTQITHFLRFLSIAVILSCQGVCFGHVVGTAANDFQQVQSLVSPSLTPLILFSGYMIPKKTIPYAFKWLYDASFFQYALTLFQINQFRGWRFHDCDDPTARKLKLCYKTGGDFLRGNALDPDKITRDYLILLAYALFLFFLSYVAYARVIRRS